MVLHRHPLIRREQLEARKQFRKTYAPLAFLAIGVYALIFTASSATTNHRVRRDANSAEYELCNATMSVDDYLELSKSDGIDGCCDELIKTEAQRIECKRRLADQYYKTCDQVSFLGGGVGCTEKEEQNENIEKCKADLDRLYPNPHSDEELWQGVNWCDTGDFPESVFTASQRQQGAVILYILGLFYMFIALAIICDEYFVPALDVMCDKDHMNLSNDVAGATLMAAGGSAPELFTSIIGVFIAESNVGIGTIVGSAVFNILFVLGACAFVVGLGPNGKSLDLTWFPVARDCFFYIVALGALIWGFSGDEIVWYESLTMFMIYVAYVVFMLFNEKIQNMITPKKEPAPEEEELKAAPINAWKRLGQKAQAKAEDAAVEQALANRDLGKIVSVMQKKNMKGKVAFLLRRQNSAAEKPEDEGEDLPSQMAGLGIEAFKEADGVIGKFYAAICIPINLILCLTVPNQQVKANRLSCGGKTCYFSFLMSIIWISVFSWLMVWWATRIGETWNIDSALMGLTILAAGTSVPDLMTSIVVSKQGHGDMAVSSSIGSNIFDVTVGLPFPWLLYNAFNGAKSVSSSGLVCSIGLLLGMLVCLVVSIIAAGWKLNTMLGALMLALYCAFVGITLAFEYGALTCPI